MTSTPPFKPLLEDQGDALVLQEAFEEAFGLRPGDDEASACRSVGDLEAVLLKRFSSSLGEPGACMTSMAFYRLRAALAPFRSGVRLSPASELATLAGRSPRAFIERLSGQSGLMLPATRLNRSGTLGTIFVLIALPVGCGVGLLSEGWQGWAVGLILIALGVICLKFDSGLLPQGVDTLGDLSRRATALNFGKLAGEGGAVNETQLREALISFLSDAGDLPVAEIRPETPILELPKQSGRRA